MTSWVYKRRGDGGRGDGDTKRQNERDEAFRAIDLSKDNLLLPSAGEDELLTLEQHH